MRTVILFFFIHVFLSVSCLAATPISYSFPESIQEAQYDRLIQELRCLVCQNQSLADSHAELAADLRKKVYEQVIINKTDEQIISYFIERYGEFVHYKPSFDYRTAFLWLGPAIFLIIGFCVFFSKVFFKKRII